VSSAPTLSASGAEAGVPVVPGRRDNECPEIAGACDGAGLRAVREGSERLDHRREGDLHRIVRGAVAVRIDRALEAGNQEIAAPRHRRAFLGSLPAEDPKRDDAGGRGDSKKQPRHPSPVGLEPGGLVRAPLRSCAPVAGNEVMARADSAAQSGMETIDSRVQERNRHTPAVESAQRDSGSLARPSARPYFSRIHPPHGIDPHDERIALELRDRAAVETRRETVEHVGEAEVRLDVHAAVAQSSQHALLHRLDVRNPLLLVRGRRPLRRRGDALRHRG
jgi:hypothetical protein